MDQIVVTILKDETGFYPAGLQSLVSRKSQIIGTEIIFNDIPEGNVTDVKVVPGLVSLKIVDPQKGNTWIEQTREEFIELMNPLVNKLELTFKPSPDEDNINEKLSGSNSFTDRRIRGRTPSSVTYGTLTYLPESYSVTGNVFTMNDLGFIFGDDRNAKIEF